MGLWDLHQELAIRSLRADKALAETGVEGRFANAQDQCTGSRTASSGCWC